MSKTTKISKEESSKLHKLIELIEAKNVSVSDARQGFVWVKPISKLGDEFFTQLFKKVGHAPTPFEMDVNYLNSGIHRAPLIPNN